MKVEVTGNNGIDLTEALLPVLAESVNGTMWFVFEYEEPVFTGICLRCTNGSFLVGDINRCLSSSLKLSNKKVILNN